MFTSPRRFVIERELGHGGMGIVYQALDLERNTRVALKALTQRDAVNIYRLKNEFRQLADLSHPNLVTLHELCNEGNSWFFTMELVNGKTFDEYAVENGASASISSDRSRVRTVAGRIVRDASITLSQRAIGGEFPLPRAICNVKRLRNALRQLVEGVAALHDAGKLHRDLKPSNVLVTPQGRVVVLDFGLVSSSTFIDADAQDADRTVGGCVFGTPAYMSPEQAAGEPITMASDWYAVGTMLYEALTGQLPFEGAVLEILRQKEETEPPPPSEIMRGVPDDLDQLCRELLRRDPRKRPSGSEILRYLTGHSAPPPVFDAQASGVVRQAEIFVGRERHLADLRDAFENAKRGKPVTVLVHGLSGMGKTALVRYFANQLIRGDEAVVLRGRCYERETVPYKAFDNIIDALSRYMMQLSSEEAAELLPRNIHALALLFPVLKRVKAVASARRPKAQTTDALELRNQAFTALKDLLLRMTDFHPLVMNIDDLQWADMDSARLLAFLMGPPDPPPLLLVGTYRRDEAENSPFLKYITEGRTLDQGGAELRQIPVDALRSDEAAQLAAAMLGEAEMGGSLAATAAAAEAEGVPFFITELVQRLKTRLTEEGLPLQVEPITLDQVILERVGSMSEGAQRLLQVLSVAAGPLEQGVAIHAAALPPGDRGTILALRAARLVRTRGTRQTDTAETYHDRVRETIVRNMDRMDMRNVHARIAAALERFSVADPERLVMHYTGAGEGVRAGETAVQAAHAAAGKLAFNRAAELFKKALELLPESHPGRRELHEYIGDALANSGRGAQAAEAYLQAAQGRQGDEALNMQRMAARQYLRSGQLTAGIALASRLFQEVGLRFPQTHARTLATYTWNRACMRLEKASGPASHAVALRNKTRLATLDAVFREFNVVDFARGAALHAQFLRYAQRSGSPQQVMEALAWEAWNVALTTRNPDPALRVLARVEQLSKQVGTPYAEATAKSARAGCAFFLGRVGEILAPATEAEHLFKERCAGSYWEQTLAATYRYIAIEHVGGFATVLSEAPTRAREARDREDQFGMAFLALSEPFANLLLDQAEAARSVLDEQRARLPSSYGSFHMWVAIRTTHTLLYLQDGPAALQYIERETKRFEASVCSHGRSFATTMRYLRGRSCLAAVKAQSSSRSELIDRAERDARAILATGQPHGRALADLLLAEVAWRRGDDEGARSVLDGCVAGVAVHQAPMFAQYARRALGSLLQGDEGRTLVERVDQHLRFEGAHAPGRWTQIWIDLEGR